VVAENESRKRVAARDSLGRTRNKRRGRDVGDGKVRGGVRRRRVNLRGVKGYLMEGRRKGLCGEASKKGGGGEGHSQTSGAAVRGRVVGGWKNELLSLKRGKWERKNPCSKGNAQEGDGRGKGK